MEDRQCSASRQTAHFADDGQSMTGCSLALPGLVLLSLALLASMILNVILFIRRRPSPCSDTATCCSPQVFDEESISQDPGHYFSNSSHGQQHQEQVDPDNYQEQLENPIYGNISANRSGSVQDCYEMMSMQHGRDRAKFADPDLNYASLDLKLAKIRRKAVHQKGCDVPQEQLPVRQATPANVFLEVNADVDAQLPSRDSGTMVSQSSIYLNSQQIAQGAKDMERERSSEGESACWDGVRCCGDGYSERKGRRDRQSYSNGSECTQLSEVEAGQSDGSFSESNQNS